MLATPTLKSFLTRRSDLMSFSLREWSPGGAKAVLSYAKAGEGKSTRFPDSRRVRLLRCRDQLLQQFDNALVLRDLTHLQIFPRRKRLVFDTKSGF